MKYDKEGNFVSMSDRQVVSSARRWAAGIVLAIIATSLISWQVGWWFKEKNTDRQVRIDNRNLGTQTAWRDEAVKTIADFELVDPANTAARGALKNKACDLIPRLRPDYTTPNLTAFAAKECK